MSGTSTIYTLNAEAAAARCRELLTTATPPPAGRALEDRKDQPPSIIVEDKVRPYKRRMWSSPGVDQWCAQRQPPRIRKALVCLARLEIEVGYGLPLIEDERLTCDVLAEILAAGDEP